MQNAAIISVPLCLMSLSGCGAGEGSGVSQIFSPEVEDGSEVDRRTQQFVPVGWTAFGERGRYCFGLDERDGFLDSEQQCIEHAESKQHVFVQYKRGRRGVKCASGAHCDKRRENRGGWYVWRKEDMWLQVGDAGHRCSGNPLACWPASDQLQQCQRAFEVNGHTIYEYNVDTKMCCECLTAGVATLGHDPGWRVFQRGTPFEPVLAITNINEVGCGVLVEDAWPIDSTALSTAGGLIRQINGHDVSCLTLCKEDPTCTAALMDDVGCFLHRDLSMWPLQFKRNTLDNPPSHQFSIFRVCHEDESVCGNSICEEGEMDLCTRDCEAEIKDAVCDCASEHDLCGETCSAVARLGSDCGRYGARGICGGIIPFDIIYSEFCGWRCPAETPVPTPPVPTPPVPTPPVPTPPVPTPPVPALPVWTSCPSHHPSPQHDMYLYCCPRPDKDWDECVGSKTQQSSCEDPLFPATAWSEDKHATTEGSFDADTVHPVNVCCTNGLRDLNVNCEVRLAVP